ncbi:Major facilitator superfamily domain general substrate transporter [Penicillium concentricum]|uniref:Major facilitator superfamily domain general substrate transporter n=1 Tax=Penicillium concentricum TaxID=293559 RepID=A0A9W9RIU2_9EURO|nr:Major facilitator superfamily domain general substrate transporter [Penicillium concentricum]KAJ5360074.1 Major facilitator superfamily domain general substrate transporter [Penicillium concentricum]
MAVDTEKSPIQAGSSTGTPSSPSTVSNKSNEPVVTLETWIVSSTLSCGYGLYFWPVPVVSTIDTMISADMGDPTGYIWLVPVRKECSKDLMVVASQGAAAMKSYSPAVVAVVEAALSQAYCKAIL